MKKFVLSLLLCPVFFSRLMAEVYVEEKVNSWTNTGYLWVVSGLALVVVLILVAVYIENRNGKKND